MEPRGVPRVDDRRVLNGVLWRFRTGSPWAEIAERYSPPTTCRNRFVRWRKAGVWDRLLEAVSTAYDGDIVMIDSTCVQTLEAADDIEPAEKAKLLDELRRAAWSREKPAEMDERQGEGVFFAWGDEVRRLGPNGSLIEGHDPFGVADIKRLRSLPAWAAPMGVAAFRAHGILRGSLLDSGRLEAPELGEAWRGIGGA